MSPAPRHATPGWDRPPSILIVTDWFPPGVGGVEAAAWALALAAAGRGCRVAVLTPALPGGPVGVRAARTPHRTHLLRIYYAPRGGGWVSRVSGGAAAWGLPGLPGVLALVRSIAARERATLIHAHSSASPLALAALAAGRALGLPAILTDHSMAGVVAGGGWAARAGRAAWAAAAAGAAPPTLLAVSTAAAACTASRLGRPPRSVTVLRNAIDGSGLAGAAADHAAAAASRPASSTIRVLSVSRLTARKGARDLGAAIRLASAADPALSFTVVGGGPGRAALLEALGGPAAAAAARVSLTGALPPAAIPPLLAAHAAFLSASATEAFGLAALEAAGVGLTVIAPDVGGVAQALAAAAAAATGQAGAGRAVRLVAPAAGPAGLAAALVAAASDLRARAPAPAPTPPLAPLAAILADHCWHVAGAEVVAVYKRAASPHRAASAFPPLRGRPLTAAARAVVHALLVAWAAVLDFLDPPERMGRVEVVVQ